MSLGGVGLVTVRERRGKRGGKNTTLYLTTFRPGDFRSRKGRAFQKWKKRRKQGDKGSKGCHLQSPSNETIKTKSGLGGYSSPEIRDPSQRGFKRIWEGGRGESLPGRTSVRKRWIAEERCSQTVSVENRG